MNPGNIQPLQKTKQIGDIINFLLRQNNASKNVNKNNVIVEAGHNANEGQVSFTDIW